MTTRERNERFLSAISGGKYGEGGFSLRTGNGVGEDKRLLKRAGKRRAERGVKNSQKKNSQEGLFENGAKPERSNFKREQEDPNRKTKYFWKCVAWCLAQVWGKKGQVQRWNGRRHIGGQVMCLYQVGWGKN